MSQESLVALLVKLRTDPDFRAKFKTARSLKDAVLIAQEGGLDMTDEELLSYSKDPQKLTDSELESMAAGAQLGGGTQHTDYTYCAEWSLYEDWCGCG